MAEIIDISWARPGAQEVLDAGYTGVIGYIGLDRTGKLLQKAWFDHYIAAGLGVSLVWELWAQRALAGYASGLADGRVAIGQAEALGYSHGSTLYFVLEDPTRLPQSQWPPVFAYANGVEDAMNEAGNPYEIGGYGSQALLTAAFEKGLISRRWYVGPWGHDYSGADIVQWYKRTHPVIAGCSPSDYDEDWVSSDDWGQHPRPAPAHPTPTQEGDEDEVVITLVKADNDNPAWFFLYDWKEKRWCPSIQDAKLAAWITRSQGGKFAWNDQAGNDSELPIRVMASDLDTVPYVAGGVKAPDWPMKKTQDPASAVPRRRSKS
jgi:hypothetical protein